MVLVDDYEVHHILLEDAWNSSGYTGLKKNSKNKKIIFNPDFNSSKENKLRKKLSMKYTILKYYNKKEYFITKNYITLDRFLRLKICKIIGKDELDELDLITNKKRRLIDLLYIFKNKVKFINGLNKWHKRMFKDTLKDYRKRRIYSFNDTIIDGNHRAFAVLSGILDNRYSPVLEYKINLSIKQKLIDKINYFFRKCQRRLHNG